mgnify:CR=1 FL=1
MDEFITTRDMVERIKDIVEPHNNGKKVFDGDVAGLLKIEPGNLATMIKRNRPPIVEIVQWCYRTGRNVNEIVFKKTGVLTRGTLRDNC